MPESIPMRASMFGDGARGMALQVSRNEEFGIQLEARREKRGGPWVTTFTCDFIPDREFKTLAEMRSAFNALGVVTPFVLFVISTKAADPKAGSMSCWRCRGAWSWTVRVKTGWRAGDESLVGSCADCLEAVTVDPGAAIEARRKWVREHPIKL